MRNVGDIVRIKTRSEFVAGGLIGDDGRIHTSSGCGWVTSMDKYMGNIVRIQRMSFNAAGIPCYHIHLDDGYEFWFDDDMLVSAQTVTVIKKSLTIPLNGRSADEILSEIQARIDAGEVIIWDNTREHLTACEMFESDLHRRLAGESNTELIVRLCNRRKEIGTWQDVTDRLNEILHRGLTMSAYKYRYQKYRQR